MSQPNRDPPPDALAPLDAEAANPGGPAPMVVAVDRAALSRLWSELRAPQPFDPRVLELRRMAEELALVEQFDRLTSLHLNTIDEYPHQLEAALRVLREMGGRALLADEVGLGKTIEAGLVLKEYLVRGMVETALVLTPPSLTRQWREELFSKFDEELVLAERPRDWTSGPRVIGSLDTAKQPRHAEQIRTRRWDLVIVDEAHRLANHRTLAYALVDSLQRRHLLLLTATPVQNDLRELFNLVSLLRPGQLGTFRRFREQFVDASDPRKPLNPARLRLLLSECMVRNRRSQVAVSLPPRRASVQSVQPSPAERRLYDAVAALSRGSGTRGAEALTQVLLLQEACSSARATASTLRKVAARQPELHPLAAEAELVTDCAKADVVARIARDVDDAVLVFTEFRETQERIRESLDAAGIEAVLFHGGQSPAERAETVRRFRTFRPVMVATPAGVEGQNLQFCNVLVNFDLPWNPLTLEQRIGRLHRLGQNREVHVFNLTYTGTFEADLLDLLANKIRMFELVVGELDLILGLMGTERSFEDALARIWLESTTPELYRQQLDRLGAEILQARAAFDEVRATELVLAEVLDSPDSAISGRDGRKGKAAAAANSTRGSR